MDELPGNHIKHKLFGYLTNHLLSHFVAIMMSTIEYDLAR